VKIKICGQTRAEDIEYSFAKGADYCGVVVEVASSKRSMTLKEATPIFKQFNGRLIALTANANAKLYDEIIKKLNPLAIQLTANETADDIENLKKLYGVKLFKSIHLPQAGVGEKGHEEFVEMIDTYQNAGTDAFILDTLVADMYGGSGKKSDWNIAGKILKISGANIFLAGGINQYNLEEAMELHPYGIDLASGVETLPGVKSKKNIDELFAIFKVAK